MPVKKTSSRKVSRKVSRRSGGSSPRKSSTASRLKSALSKNRKSAALIGALAALGLGGAGLYKYKTRATAVPTLRSRAASLFAPRARSASGVYF